MKKKEYIDVLSTHSVKRPIVKNAIRAFLFGGVVALIGEIVLKLFERFTDLSFKDSSMYMAMILITIASILTGVGVFDRIGEKAGAGTYLPITGFANSMTSSAMESKSEGLILGILTNIFKLTGAIIATAIISSFVMGIIIYLVRM